MTYIKESYHSNMTLQEATKLVLQVLKNVMEEKIAKDNVEITIIRTDTRKLESKKGEDLEELIQSLS